MKTIGIKLADGTFYPVMEELENQEKTLDLTTANNNQTRVMVDLYRSSLCTMDDAEYVDTLQIDNLVAHPNGEPDISFSVSIDDEKKLSAKIVDRETGSQSNTTITLVSRTVEERLTTDEYDISDADDTSENDGSAALGAAVAGGGLLAAAAALGNNDSEDSDSQESDLEFSSDSMSDPSVIEDTEVTFDTAENSLGPDFEMNASDETISDDLSDISTDETISEDLPDFSSDTTDSLDLDGISSDETISDTDDLSNLSDFDLPDDVKSEELSDFDVPDFNTAQDSLGLNNEETSDFSTDFDNDISESTSGLDDDFFEPKDSKNDSFSSSSSNGLSFTGLYDKETELGESGNHEDEEIKKRTKLPVIICVACAIICILATLFILFVIPGVCKNSKGKKEKTAKKQKTEIVKTEQQEPVKSDVVEIIPEAKEDEVIIVEKAEEVIPQQPPAPVVEKEKPKNTTYKIKWGDTLWDIAGTYYKNPWRYKYIAKYNGIKDPDYIISGTIITIPAE